MANLWIEPKLDENGMRVVKVPIKRKSRNRKRIQAMMKFDANVDEDAIRLAITKALKENTACIPTVLNNFFDDGSTSEVSVQKNLIRGAKMSPEFQKKFDEAEAENLKKLERLSNQSNKRGYNGSN